MRNTFAALFLSALFTAALQIPFALAHRPRNSHVVDLGYATYESNLSLLDGVTSFLGIRYAAPPTGTQRFKAPQPPAFTPGIQNATTQPQQCFQAFLAGAQGVAATSPFRQSSLYKRDVGPVFEDCLFLNVHVPTTPQTRSLLPVIVYIHGGGYDAGNVTVFPVEDFVQGSNNGLVVVQIQYRLGVFGFLAGEKVKQGGNLNVGLLDQNFALEWVQQHITKFGGDPTKVTIWGQSAGAGSMLQHIVANGGNTQPPLFRAVLMNSLFLPFQYPFNDPIPEALYSKVVAHVNCADAEDTFACLQSTPAPLLLDADSTIGLSNFMGTYSFVPVIDGSLIVERPTVTLQRGRVNGHALLASTNAHEGDLFVIPAILTANNITFLDYVTQLFPRMNQDQINQAVSLYLETGLTAVSDLASLVMGDSIFVCPTYNTLQAFGSQGRKALLAIPPAFHAEDLSYEMPTFAIPPTFNNPLFIKSWEQAFLSTALTLDANNHIDSDVLTPEWNSWGQTHTEMLFNKTESDQPVVQTFTTNFKQLERCLFWNSVAAVNSQ